MALPAGLAGAVAAELAVGGAEVTAVGDDPHFQEIAVDDEAWVTTSAEGGDLVVAVELLADAEAERVRVLPEKLVERHHVVGVERFLVALEDRRDLGQDLGSVDFHCCS